MERLDRFMARANAAYYATQDPFHDFTTAPEISQVFGELLGLWAAIVWERMGHPKPILLVELGPGRGTLMRDALRAIAQAAPRFRAAAQVHLVETSPRLRAQQAALVDPAQWHDSVDTLPTGPVILLANEFLDALPIRQFVGRANTWAERFVTNEQSVEAAADPGAPSPPAPEGEIRETCPAAIALATWIATRLGTQGGAALLIDYGPAASAPGDSLQALRNGRPANPFANPGAADLTAHVDFEAIAKAAHQAGATAHGPLAQGLLLARLGLFQRSGALARTQPPAKAAALIQAAQRLAEPDRMGRLFKALAITHPTLGVPPGFEPEGSP